MTLIERLQTRWIITRDDGPKDITSATPSNSAIVRPPRLLINMVTVRERPAGGRELDSEWLLRLSDGFIETVQLVFYEQGLVIKLEK